MAEVIKEVTKELQDKEDALMGRKKSFPVAEKKIPERGCLPWKKDGSSEAAKSSQQRESHTNHLENGESKKKDVYQLATDYSNAKKGKHATPKRLDVPPAQAHLGDELTTNQEMQARRILVGCRSSS